MDKNSIIEQLYQEHKDHIYNFLARMANDPDLALDVTQQTFVKALSDKNFYKIDKPKAYLFTIARNTLFNEFKKKKATSLDAIEENDGFEAVDPDENMHETAEIKDIQLKVEKSISRMPAKTKELMILRYTEDLSIKEISHITGRTLSDIKVNLHRARIKFETSFTHEMYAKIAVSRDQCETLTTLLTPYIDSEIPEYDLKIVDKHISACQICFEDSEQLKRSRTLFNFAALLSAPYILDKMMGEAMASELDFFSNSDNAASAAKTSSPLDNGSSSATSTSSTTNVSGSIISLKAASIIATTIIILITVVITVLLDDKTNDPATIITPPGPTITTTPAPSTPIQKTKLDPDVTTIVNFKARNTKTGKDIKQGLKWDIFSTADSSGKATSDKPQEIKTSNTASFEIILNSGYYLAKVTYKGKSIKSEFAVRDDTPVNIKLDFSDLPEVTEVETKVNAPTIHIRRLETGTHESKPLKINWDLCVETIKLYKHNREKYPEMWRMQEEELKEQNPDFNLDRGLAPEPNWSKLTENYEDEYFSGDKYALYSKTNYYEVSEDGSCKLNKSTEESATIDDGQFNYYINFIEKIAEKTQSSAASKREVNAMYQNFNENNPLLAQITGQAISQAMLGTSSEQEKQAIKAVKELEALTEIAGTETMAGEICEYTVLGEQAHTRICYWQTMHEYPSIMKRPIILGSTVDLAKDKEHFLVGKQIERAILFEKNLKLDNSIFSVPSDFKINDINDEMMQE